MGCAYKQLLALAGAFLIIFSSVSLADGGFFVQRPDDNSVWELKDMENQVCAINYDKGVEKMLLSVQIDGLNSSRAVWIFPVPAKPDDVLIDTFDSFPEVSGYNIKSEAKDRISGYFILMAMSQVYTLPVGIMGGLVFNTMSAGNIGAVSTQGDYKGSIEGVTVYERVEKLGLTTELITAEDGQAFYSYLVSRNLAIPEKFDQIVSDYLNKDYSFVVSWYTAGGGSVSGSGTGSISSLGLRCCMYKSSNTPYWTTNNCGSSLEMSAEFCENMLGTDFLPSSRIYGYQDYSGKRLSVFVSFPTKKIYFPMKLTSTYESRKIPMTIYVFSHVTPKVYDKIKDYTKVSYLVDSYYSVPEDLSGLFGDDRETIYDLGYTKIDIDAPSKFLVDDLWIEPHAPASVYLASSIYSHTGWWALFIFLLCSCVASLAAGFIVFRNDVKSKSKFALLGIANIFTLIGFAIATLFIETRTPSKELKKKLKEENLKAWDERKLPFIAVFSVFFLVILVVFYILLLLL